MLLGAAQLMTLGPRQPSLWYIKPRLEALIAHDPIMRSGGTQRPTHFLCTDYFEAAFVSRFVTDVIIGFRTGSRLLSHQKCFAYLEPYSSYEG